MDTLIFDLDGSQNDRAGQFLSREGRGNTMQQELTWLAALAPDLIDSAKLRFQILQQIHWLAPIGRRVLAQRLSLTERSLRTETTFLRENDLITMTKSGMMLTAKGSDVLQHLAGTMAELSGIKIKEKQLADLLHLDHCSIVAADLDQQPKVLETMGRLLNEILQQNLPKGEAVVAAMGGTTMAAVANQLTPALSENRQLTFVPARGGLGEAVDVQANSVCAQMALNTNGTHRVLYIPEHVSERVYQPLLEEPVVKEVLTLVDKSVGVVHSIGVALQMAERRDMPADTIQMLKRKHAVGEAFGYFFNEQGQIVYKIPQIGLQLEKLKKTPCIVAIAGGAKKADAIKAYAQLAPHQTWLITDEGAANLILKGVTL
jgi:central glycolytic genes regulator